MGDGFIIDSLPLPVCRRVRAQRCRKAPGRACCGECAAKRETFFGWRVHLVRRLHHALTRVPMRPAGAHDLTPPAPPERGEGGGNWGRMACPPGRGDWAERR